MNHERRSAVMIVIVRIVMNRFVQRGRSRHCENHRNVRNQKERN